MNFGEVELRLWQGWRLCSMTVGSPGNGEAGLQSTQAWVFDEADLLFFGLWRVMFSHDHDRDHDL